MDVRKTLTETGYVAVGLGVLGAQQAQSLARTVTTEVHDQISSLRKVDLKVDLDGIKDKLDLGALPNRVDLKVDIDGIMDKLDLDGLRDRVTKQAKQSAERAGAFTDELRGRVEPVIERAKSLVGSAA